MAKIPSKRVMEKGVRVLAEVYQQIDKQVGAESKTHDDKVSDTEVATFLRQRGARSDTAGAAVATMSAYVRHITPGDVPLADLQKTLAKVTGYVDRDRAKGLQVAEMKPTWRALALFAQEVKTKGLTAEEIVADRSRRPVGDLVIAKQGLDTVAEIFDEIGKTWGDGKLTTDAVRAFVADGPSLVATTKEAVRMMTRYLESRTHKTEFTQKDVGAALQTARTALQKNASGPDDRGQLAGTWRALLAFADENSVRGKGAKAIVGAPRGAAPVAAGGPRAADVAAFRKLDTETKKEILDDYGNLHGHYTTSGEKKIGELTGPAKAFADKMLKELTSLVGDFEDDSGVYGTIGGPDARAEVISLPNGDIVGGRIWVIQRGFNAENAPPDDEGDTPYHFDTAAECDAAGVDSGEDISWQVNGLFETTSAGAVQLGESYENVSDHWEWSGY